MGGRKVFTAGEVLTAADTNDYLMDQSVMVFAGTAARASAISAPSEGMVTYLADTDDVEVYTGADWQSITAGAVAGDNLLYNGAMQVAQRGTSVSGITASNANYRTVDRYLFSCNGSQVTTISLENDAPTGSGFRKSTKVLVTTADATPGANDEIAFFQRLEGQDLQRVAKGTASAKQLTLSFWVKSNVTGTFIAELFDYDNSRQCSQSYTISASATWEKKTVTFPADTTGALDNDNGASFHALFWLAAGSNYTTGTLATTWQAYDATDRAVGQTDLGATLNNYWQITGVQLEVGDAATDFEFKSYGQDLAECQRYYYRIQNSVSSSSFGSGFVVDSTTGEATIIFPVTLRASVSAIDTTAVASDYRWAVTNSSIALSSLPILLVGARTSARVRGSVASGLTAGQAIALIDQTGTAYLGFSAEL